MKKVIYVYYNILIDKINKENNNFYFYYNDDLYLFSEVISDYITFNNICLYVIENNIDSYKVIKNKDNDYITKVDKKNYALIKVDGIYKYEIKINEFKYYPIKSEGLDWGLLWGNRIDYYEIQLRELGINYQNILNSFGFFSGLVENAILYYNLTLKNYEKDIVDVGIVHYRVNYPCYSIFYNNPLNFVVDYSIRDISEYIKSYLLSDDYVFDNIILMLDNLKLNNKMFNLLYARLLYPSFYFDIYDKVLLNDENEVVIMDVINNVDKYLDMLRKIYFRYKEQYQMFNIEWLNKKM